MGGSPLPDAVRRDPLFQLAGSGSQRWIFIALIAASTAALLVVPGLAAGGRQTTIQLVGRLVWGLVGVPVALFLYFWVPIAVSSLIPELARNGVLVDPEAAPGAVADSATDINRLMDSSWWPVAGVVAVGATVATELIGLASGVSAAVWGTSILALAGTAIPIYAGTVMLLRLVAGMFATSQAIGRATARVVPLHSDQAGGWGGFGRRFFVIARAGLVYGLVAIVVNLGVFVSGDDPTQSLASMITFSYFVFLPPLVVWAWFFAPHRAMLEARAEILGPISREAEAVRLAGIDDVDAKDPAAPIRLGSDWIAELVRRHDLIVATHPDLAASPDRAASRLGNRVRADRHHADRDGRQLRRRLVEGRPRLRATTASLRAGRVQEFRRETPGER